MIPPQTLFSRLFCVILSIRRKFLLLPLFVSKKCLDLALPSFHFSVIQWSFFLRPVFAHISEQKTESHRLFRCISFLFLFLLCFPHLLPKSSRFFSPSQSARQPKQPAREKQPTLKRARFTESPQLAFPATFPSSHFGGFLAPPLFLRGSRAGKSNLGRQRKQKKEKERVFSPAGVEGERGVCSFQIRQHICQIF